jgi:hypothetical protein
MLQYCPIAHVVACTHADAGVSFVVGLTVTGIYAIAIQSILLLVPMHADAGVSTVVSPVVTGGACLPFHHAGKVCWSLDGDLLQITPCLVLRTRRLSWHGGM